MVFKIVFGTAVLCLFVSVHQVGFPQDTQAEKPIIVITKPVVDKLFFDSISILRSKLDSQVKKIDSLAADNKNTAELKTALTLQTQELLRLKRIFNKLPEKTKREIIELERKEPREFTPEKKSLSYPEIVVIEPKRGVFERIRIWFKKQRK